LQVAVAIIDRLDEQAFAGVTWDDGGFCLAATKEARAGIESESPFDLFTFIAVALVTVLDENRADFLFKKSELGRVIGGQDDGGRDKEKSARDEDGELDRPGNHIGNDFLVGRIWKKAG